MSDAPKLTPPSRPPPRWPRRLRRIGLIVLCLVVVFRLSLLILLPLVINRTARTLGLECDYQRLKLSLLGTNASLWGVEIKARDGTQPLIKTEYANANLSTLQLFRLRLVVWRVEADGVEVEAVRKADGTLPLLSVLTSIATPKAPSSPSKVSAPKKPDFSSPLEVRALRLHKLAVHLKDETLNPPFEDTVRIDLRVSDLGRSGVPVRIEFDASSKDLFSSASVAARATITRDSIAADLGFTLRGLRANRLDSYLAAAGLSADDRGLDVAGKGTLNLTASDTTPGDLQGSVALSGISVRADSAPVASLDSVTIDIAALSPSTLHVRDVQIKNGSLQTERTAEGRVRLAAFAPRFGAAQPARPSAHQPAPATPPTTATGSRFHWQVDRIQATQLAAMFDDHAVFPRQILSFQVAQAAATDLRSDGPASTATAFNATMSMPGIVGTIRAQGTASPFLPEPKAHGSIEVDAIRPNALAPYFKALGIESTIDSAAVRIVVDVAMKPSPAGPMQTDLTFDRIVIEDQSKPLFDVGPVKVSGVSLQLSGMLNVDSIEGAGPAINMSRLKDGRFEVLGLWIGPAPVQPLPMEASTHTPSAATAPPLPPRFDLPSLRLGKLTWSGVKIRFEDLAMPETAPFELSDATFELSNFQIGAPAGAGAATPPPGTLKARVRVPGVLDDIAIEGTLDGTSSSIEARLAARGSGISLIRLAPYLSPLGIEPTLDHATFSSQLNLGASQVDNAIRLTASSQDVALTQNDKTLLSIPAAGIDRIDVGADHIAIGKATVSKFKLDASRDKTGIAVLGVKLRPVPAAGPAPDAPIPDPLALLGLLGKVSIETASLDDARISWSDTATKTPVSTEATISASLSGLHLNSPESLPARFDLHAQAAGLAQDFQVEGTLVAGDKAVHVDARCAGHGIATSLPAAYLPPGIDSALEDGELSLAVGFALKRADADALAGAFTIRDFDYRARGASDAFAHLDSFDLEVQRAEPATGNLHVRRISAQGVAARVEGLADGSASLLGLCVRTPPPSPESTAAPATKAAADVRGIIDRSRRAASLIEVDEVDFGITRLAFHGPAPAVPVALAETHVRTTKAFRLLGPDAAGNAPAQFIVQGRIDPLVAGFDVNGQAAPFANEPSLNLALTARGISGAPLTQILPDLAPFIDGASLTDGRFKTSLSAHAKVQRRGPTSIDWSRGADISLSIENTEFRSGETGPILAGVNRVQADSIKFDPSTRNAIAHEVEVENITGTAWRDEAGVHIFGLIVKPPIGKDPTSESASAPAQAAAPAPVPAQPPPAGPEFRIDRLTATGLDFRFEDRAVQPPVTIPFNSLDAEFRGISSLILERERPVRFNLSVGAGKVSVPKPGRGSSDPAQEVEDRDFFSQCTASGTFAGYPNPRGRALMSISGVELAAVRGLAQEAGASLGGGVFDGRLDLRGRDDGSVQARTRLILTDLRYSEPSQGPVERYMGLPVPIQAAIVAVEAPDGSITLPVDVTIDKSGLGTGKLVGAIAGAAGQVVATAVLSAPVKVVSGFAGLFGSTHADIQWIEEPPVALEYPDGITTLKPESLTTLNAVLERARSSSNIQVAIEHDLGSADAALASQRANPSAADVTALARDVRQRRAELLAAREQLLPPASAWSLGISPDSDAQVRLRRINLQLADLEDSMDQLYALLGSGAETLKARRARSAALELIDARMSAVRRSIDQVAGSQGATRIALAGNRPVAGESEHSRLIIRVRKRK